MCPEDSTLDINIYKLNKSVSIVANVVDVTEVADVDVVFVVVGISVPNMITVTHLMKLTKLTKNPSSIFFMYPRYITLSVKLLYRITTNLSTSNWQRS